MIWENHNKYQRHAVNERGSVSTEHKAGTATVSVIVTCTCMRQCVSQCNY